MVFNNVGNKTNVSDFFLCGKAAFFVIIRCDSNLSGGGNIHLGTHGLEPLYGNNGIIAPGPTPDGMLPDEWSEAYRSVTPTKRLSRAVDHAGLMLFLASDLSAGINECEIPVDGGLTASLYLNQDSFGVP